MEHFTPISAAIGGLLIGLSAILFLYLNGRIAGISGIFHGLAFSARNEFSWRILFILGLVTGCTAYYFIPVIQFIPRSHYPRYLLILSGILVSVGTKLHKRSWGLWFSSFISSLISSDNHFYLCGSALNLHHQACYPSLIFFSEVL
jgi:uncharacterized membrane protein YedE/YeeE